MPAWQETPTCMPLPLVLWESIGVLLTSEGIWKRSLDEELRGVFGRNAAELDSAASTPGVAFDLRPDILRSSSVVSGRCYEYESSKCTRFVAWGQSGMPADLWYA
jgi:hypothetical protein